MTSLQGRQRGQDRKLGKEPARAWGGDDPMVRIAAVEKITEPAVCPDCHILSRLVHLSSNAVASQAERSVIPCNYVNDVLRTTRCILCTIANNSVVRQQEAMAGHIWFLIGEASDEQQPKQEALNQHYWSVVAQAMPRQRQAARNHILELAASKAFGSLHLPHICITPEERQWLLSEMDKNFGPTFVGVFGEEAVNAFIDQYGVPLLMTKRTPKPDWVPRVRFVPTPEGVEAYRTIYGFGQSSNSSR